MRNRLIAKLDYTERQWLFKAVVQMIISDRSIATEELEDLKGSLKQLAGPEFDDIGTALKSPALMGPLKVLNNIRLENALIIIFEISRVAAIDCKLVLEETNLLDEVIAKLGFNDEAAVAVLEWTRKLAEINRKEDELKELLSKSFRPKTSSD